VVERTVGAAIRRPPKNGTFFGFSEGKYCDLPAAGHFSMKNARAADRRPYDEIRNAGRNTGDADPSAALRALRMT